MGLQVAVSCKITIESFGGKNITPLAPETIITNIAERLNTFCFRTPTTSRHPSEHLFSAL